MKIVVALPRFPFPTLKGDMLRAYYQIKHLHKNHEVHLFCLSDKPIDAKHISEVEAICTSLQVVTEARHKRILRLFKTFINRLPFQVNYFHSPTLKRKLKESLDKESPDVIYFQLLRMGLNVPQRKGNTFFYLDYMDCFSAGMKKRGLDGSFISLPKRIEAGLLRKYETSIANKFDGFSIISEPDLNQFHQKVSQKMDVIPNGVGAHFFEKIPPLEKNIDLVFTGNMSYPPNVDACRYLVNVILTEMLRRGHELRIALVGTNPSKEVMVLKSKNVMVTGFVEDVRPWLSSAKVFIAPMKLGSGLQNKLLEGMAAGLPTITSGMANLALGAENDKQIIVCENLEDYCKAIINLLDNPNKAKLLGLAGQQFIRDNYSWESHNQKLENILVSKGNRTL